MRSTPTKAVPIRILLADDSERIRRAICTLLNSEPTITVVAEASDYEELLSKLGETNIDVDVVLMDVYMPNAATNAAFIKDQLRGSCLLAISFSKDEETIRLAKSYGAVRLLDKMELSNTLVPAINECMEQRPKQIA
jgi:DNA-binding NarL/FixJ family response regulator